MERGRRAAGWILGLYGLYLIKSFLGISLLPNYSAPRWVKMPIAPIMEARFGKDWH